MRKISLNHIGIALFLFTINAALILGAYIYIKSETELSNTYSQLLSQSPQITDQQVFLVKTFEGTVVSAETNPETRIVSLEFVNTLEDSFNIDLPIDKLHTYSQNCSLEEECTESLFYFAYEKDDTPGDYNSRIIPQGFDTLEKVDMDTVNSQINQSGFLRVEYDKLGITIQSAILVLRTY